MARIKPKTEPPVHCLFHDKTGCNCIHPVTDEKTLKMRIESAKRLKELQKKYGIE